jgi:drug/metabolite transporter (DMT)-like permease
MAQPQRGEIKGHENLGLALGLVGVTIFAATLPMTRLGVPSLGPQFITTGRAAIAGMLGLIFLAARAQPIPWPQMPRLALAALCLVAGFPGFSSLAMQTLPAAHAGVFIGLLPLATVVVAVILGGERPSPGFWACAVLGAVLVAGFAAHHGGAALQTGDAWLLLAIAVAALGYALCGQLSREITAGDVISWLVVLSLPVSLPLAWNSRPSDLAAVPIAAWTSLAYLGIMSMYLGFFAWNAGMALGGVARVSQAQLSQSFITLGISALLLGEHIDGETIVCAVLVVGLVFLGRNLRVATASLDPAGRRA